ncbi:MAG: MBL fold metallo-hydrolase [Pseudomonadales bacterium]|nr:MBL fold metallo-hydrolase [Pseudomonadales bacterium]
MRQRFSRRNFLCTGGQVLGATSLGGVLASSAPAQAATTDITRVDLGYAWVLQGAGCNVFTIPGMSENGALMVDGGLAMHSDALLNAVFDITGQDRVHTLINTHWHPEQTGSNERVGATGAVIFAHEKSQMYLKNAVLSALYEGRYGPLADVGIPNRTTRGEGSMKFAGQEIIYGYLPAAHTDGDLFLYFPMLDTLIAGGPVTAGQWPVLDIRNGAWMGGLLRAYEKLSTIVSADTVVIPAHGPIISGTDILRMRAMYTLLHLELAKQLNLGMGPDDIVAMGLLDAYTDEFGDPTTFLDHAHRSLQLAYVPD